MNILPTSVDPRLKTAAKENEEEYNLEKKARNISIWYPLSF